MGLTNTKHHHHRYPIRTHFITLLEQTRKTEAHPHCKVLMCRTLSPLQPPSIKRKDRSLVALHFSSSAAELRACVQRGWWGGNIDGLQAALCFMGTGQSKQRAGGVELFSWELGLIHFEGLGYISGWCTHMNFPGVSGKQSNYICETSSRILECKFRYDHQCSAELTAFSNSECFSILWNALTAAVNAHLKSRI